MRFSIQLKVGCTPCTGYCFKKGGLRLNIPQIRKNWCVKRTLRIDEFNPAVNLHLSFIENRNNKYLMACQFRRNLQINLVLLIPRRARRNKKEISTSSCPIRLEITCCMNSSSSLFLSTVLFGFQWCTSKNLVGAVWDFS